MESTYITLVQAAALCGLSPSTLRYHAWRGRLQAVHLGRDWLTTREWLDAYLAQRPDWAQRERPAHC